MTTYQCPRHGQYEAIEAGLMPAGIPTTCRECSDEAEIERVRAQGRYFAECARWEQWMRTGLPLRYRNRTLGNWRPRAGQDAVSLMVATWASNIWNQIEAGEGLLLIGAPGVGKTHLLAGLVTAAALEGVESRYASWPEVWNRCRPPFIGNPEEILRELANVDFLALDELGLRASSEKEQARLFELIDSRYSRRLTTVVATNLTLASLNAVGERTADRLREACVAIAIPGDSYREAAASDRALQEAAWPLQKPTRPRLVLTMSKNGEDRRTQWEAKAA